MDDEKLLTFLNKVNIKVNNKVNRFCNPLYVHYIIYYMCICTQFCVVLIMLQVQRDPRDSTVIEYHEKSKATSIIHTLEPKGKEIGKN